jgi:outer membrane lipoprotein SlyB
MNGKTLCGIAASVIVLAACSPPPPAAPLPPGVSQAPAGSVFYGSVESIEPVTQQTGSSGVLGTVIGGVAGGVLGNQIGGGTGRTIATIGGVVAGGVAGNQLERRANSGTETLYRVNVRLEDGRLATVTQRNPGNLRVGDRAQVANDMATPY